VIPLEDNQLLLDRWNTVKLRQFLCSTTGDEAATTTMYGRKQARRGTAVSSVSVEPIHSRTGSAPPASQKFIPFQILAPRATPSFPHTHEQLPHSRTPTLTSNSNTVISLASYPRCGNTLLRTHLESLTSIITGSNTRPDRTLSRSLRIKHHFYGEGILHSNKGGVQVVKTHYPERPGRLGFTTWRVIRIGTCAVPTPTHSVWWEVFIPGFEMCGKVWW